MLAALGTDPAMSRTLSTVVPVREALLSVAQLLRSLTWKLSAAARRARGKETYPGRAG
jgi:hypothetical protein